MALKKNVISTHSKKLKVIDWDLSHLRPYSRNPRKNDKAIERMVASIKEFGFTVPALIKSDGEVIDGHLRLKAATKLKMTSVPVIVCDGWTDAQVKAFRLLVNKSVSWAEWDPDLVAAELADLKLLKFDLLLTGFDVTEVDEYLRIVPTFEPVSIDEQGQLDQKSPVTCPECGHQFTPKT